MLNEMYRILRKKIVEIVIFIVWMITTNVMYFGYYRWQDPLLAIVFAFLFYGVYGHFMRVEEPWSIGDCIDREKYYIIAVTLFASAFWVSGYAPSMSIPMYLLLVFGALTGVIFVDKARYLENDGI